MPPVMSGNVNGQPMSISSMNSRASDLTGILDSGPAPPMMPHPNQYALGNMMPGPGMHDRELLINAGIPMGGPHIPPHLLPHVPPHPVMQMGGPGRGTPYMVIADSKLADFNRKLNQRNDECDNIWWDSLISDFFEEDAILTVTFTDEGPPKRYTIGRTLIPRYFRSIFESGCSEYSYILRTVRENFTGNAFFIESETAQMMMTFPRPIPSTFVTVEGRLVLEFSADDYMMRIRAWNFQIRTHREFILKTMPNFGINQEQVMRDLSNNITINGIPKNTLNFFRMCNILEPMQELMSRQKAYSLSPKDCLKTTLFQKWQRMVAPPGQQQKSDSGRQSNKRRKRKGSNANSDSASNRSSKRKQSPVPSLPNINQPGDVMIVGEPTLMGGEFGDEDERSITRLENTQYDSNNNNPNLMSGGMNAGGPMMSHVRQSLPQHQHHHQMSAPSPQQVHQSQLQQSHQHPGPPPPHHLMNHMNPPGPHFPIPIDVMNNNFIPNSQSQLLSQSPLSMNNNNSENTINKSSPCPTPNNKQSIITTQSNQHNNGPNSINNIIKSEPRINTCNSYPTACSTPGTTKTSSGSHDPSNISDDHSITKSSKTTGPPRPTSHGNQVTDKPRELSTDQERPISEPLPQMNSVDDTALSTTNNTNSQLSNNLVNATSAVTINSSTTTSITGTEPNSTSTITSVANVNNI